MQRFHRKISTLFLLLFITAVTVSNAHAPDRCNDQCSWCPNGRCLVCKNGWYGHNCNSKCENCWTGGCHKHSGKCVQCLPGTYKERCQTVCPTNCRADRNKDVFCERETGKCLDGCQEGKWGDICDKHCSVNCKGGCIQDNGHCIGDCMDGWRGLKCDIPCPSGCIKCRFDNGVCVSDCKDGKRGLLCDADCPFKCKDRKCSRDGSCLNGCKDGAWGKHCEIRYAKGCLNDQFNHHTGQCLTGCKKGFHGDYCSIPNFQHCVNHTFDANEISLVCTDGCESGWTTECCQQRCATNCLHCDQRTGMCTSCRHGRIEDQCQHPTSKMLSASNTDNGTGIVHANVWFLVLLAIISC